MNDTEANLVRAEIEALTRRAEAAECCRDRYKRERDEARAILAHSKTSLAENFNDPASSGNPGENLS